MSLLNIFVAAYLVISIVIGLYAARRVSSCSDYALAGRSLPLPIVVATVFGTWFGAETVLGISSAFLKENLRGVVPDPFGAALSLVVIGILFAAPLYRLNTLIGGVLYFLIALIPMYLAYSATLVNPALVERLMIADPQLILPTLVLEHMPATAQVMFFGALLCAILSSASAALLAPAVSFTENVLCPFVPRLGDRQRLAITRIAVACFTLIVLASALGTGATIYQMVESAAKVTLVSAFVPLAAGLYWKRATTQGAVCSMALGVIAWAALELAAPDGFWPPHLAGLGMSVIGMAAGSLVSARAATGKTPARHHLP